jgi:tRNA pseudouridine13 synthase
VSDATPLSPPQPGPRDALCPPIGWDDLPRAHGEPPARARWRATPEDFLVDEVLGFEPAGNGQHVLLQLRKRGTNTSWVARELSRLAGVAPVAVGYSGLKDRDAVTTQWFSVDLAGRAEPDWAGVAPGAVEVLAAHRHDRKLRRGSHRANRFALRLREVAGDHEALETRLARLREAGIPNYFGEQRFGRDGGNPDKALAMLAGRLRVKDRAERGLYLSTARSVLFNRVLAARVVAGTWDRLLPGEVLMLDGRHSRFLAAESTDQLVARVSSGELHPTGPLWGRGEAESRDQARGAEAAALAGCEAWCRGLEQAGLEQDRRALRVLTRDLAWRWLGEDALELTFTLPAGAYATALLREVVRPAGPGTG